MTGGEIGWAVFGSLLGAMLMNIWWGWMVRKGVCGIHATMQPDLDRMESSRADFEKRIDAKLQQMREHLEWADQLKKQRGGQRGLAAVKRGSMKVMTHRELAHAMKGAAEGLRSPGNPIRSDSLADALDSAADRIEEAVRFHSRVARQGGP